MTNYRIITILLFSIFFIPLHANYVIGTYNIRLQTTSDTGDKDWENRKQYVAQNISEHNMDVCGLNELKPNQKKDLLSLLPNYEIESWGRDSWQISNSGEGVGIAYLKNKFSKIESGHFFLAPDLSFNSIAWDASYRRLAVWIKLKDKATGTIFYYCSTHLEQAGQVAKRKGAAIVVEQMRKIAKNNPCFIAGDLNAKEQLAEVHMPFLAYYSNAFDISATTPVGNGTYGGWTTTSTNRIDHIYTLGWEVLNYTTIAEDFGRSVTPSDHLPIMIEVKLGSGPKTIAYQNDLQKTIDNAALGDTIDLRGMTIMNNSIRIAKTIVLRNGIFNNSPISVEAPAALHIIDCSFNDVKTAIQAQGYALVAQNCTFSNCTSDQYGGALLVKGRLDLSQCSFNHNSAQTAGGAIAFLGTFWSGRINQCLFDSNTSGSGAAIYVIGTDDIAVRNSSFVFNTATENGAFAWIDQINKTKIQLLNCTFAENKNSSVSSFKDNVRGGSSIYVYGDTTSIISLLNCTIVRDTNTCYTSEGAASEKYHGAAVLLRLVKVRMLNNLILANVTSANNNGDYYGMDVNELNNKNNQLSTTSKDFSLLGEVSYANNLAIVPLLSKIYAGLSICTLEQVKLSETYYEDDINDDGRYEDFLHYDIIGQSRPSSFATIGALEYQDNEQALPLTSIVPTTSKQFMTNGHIRIKNNNKTYSILGQIIQ